MTTGASDDLARVSEISRAMVHEYAMGTSITSLKIAAHGGEVSDRTRELRDEEQQHLADQSMRMARELLLDHRAALDALAMHLLRTETLQRDDIEAIMSGVRRSEAPAPGHRLRVVAASDESGRLLRPLR